jgi:hypothetical protein
MTEIRASTVLPAIRKPVTLRTADGIDLIGELALPERAGPVATLIGLHPLPTAGGMMDSHLLRKASYRLPALAPELDDYLRPDEARARFARVPQAEIVVADKAKHLWVGEPYVRIVLNEIVRHVNPAAWPLPTEWKDPP